MRLPPSLIVVFCLCLASCGFKGPLYISKDEKASSQQKNDSNHTITPKESSAQ